MFRKQQSENILRFNYSLEKNAFVSVVFVRTETLRKKVRQPTGECNKSTEEPIQILRLPNSNYNLMRFNTTSRLRVHDCVSNLFFNENDCMVIGHQCEYYMKTSVEQGTIQTHSTVSDKAKIIFSVENILILFYKHSVDQR